MEMPMRPWPRNPIIYEINTWVWLDELSRKAQRPLTLGSIPEEAWDGLASHGFDAVWLMGVWERSPVGIEIANRNEGLLAEFRRALPDFRPQDNVGSPYCVHRYVVDEHLGGAAGLAAARQALSRRGIRLVLDFVPNHVAPDHPWVDEHPEFFIRGSSEDLSRDPASFLERGGTVFACGRDPYFPAWQDVVQVNAFERGLRQAAIDALRDIATQCDGLRCDMAMLLMNAVFARTWGRRAGARPETEYWAEIIPAIRWAHPEFLFIAEAYWDTEWELQQQGFNYCYDKRLYDRLEHDPAESVRLHVCADPAYQQKLVRFVENHDEPRAAATFAPGKGRAAAMAILTLTGAKLLHEGQMEGRKVRLPVFLARRPAEAADLPLQEFYRALFRVVATDVFRSGQWQLCERRGWPDNQTCMNLLAWCWLRDDTRYLIVINLSGVQSQGSVQVPWDALRGKAWRLTDPLTGEIYDRSGDEMRDVGLYVDLGPWRFHCLRFQPM